MKLPSWYTAIGYLLLIFFVVITLAYKIGASDIRFIRTGYSKLSFDRSNDYQLYKINDSAAFSVRGNDFSIIQYTKAAIPFCYLCGEFTTDGSVLNGVEFQNGDLFYRKYIEFEGNDIFNIKTGEAFEATNDVSNLPMDESYKLTAEKISANYKKLSVMNESCLIFNMAFIILFGLWILMFPFVWFAKKRT